MREFVLVLAMLVPSATIFESIILDEPEYIMTEAEWNAINPPEPTEAIDYFDVSESASIE